MSFVNELRALFDWIASKGYKGTFMWYKHFTHIGTYGGYHKKAANDND